MTKQKYTTGRRGRVGTLVPRKEGGDAWEPWFPAKIEDLFYYNFTSILLQYQNAINDRSYQSHLLQRVFIFHVVFVFPL